MGSMDSAVAEKLDGRLERGERTRRQILDLAVHLASAEGLEGVSIGKLAAKLKMSKSGLFASFGSKEDLQFATIERARQIFIDAVVRRAMMAPRGLPRLWALWRSPCDMPRSSDNKPRALPCIAGGPSP